MSNAYEHGIQAGVDRRKDLDRKALNAQWDGARGDHAGVIVQLRQRGNAAARRATYILLSLAAVIFLGLAFYLGQPFAHLWVDGERIALSRQLEDTKTAAAALRVGMDTQRQGYEDALADSLEVIETPNRATLLGHAEIDDGLLFYGENGTLFRTAPDGTVVSQPFNNSLNKLLENLKFDPLFFSTEGRKALMGHAGIDGGLLFYGDRGALFRTASDGTEPSELLDTPNAARLYGHTQVDGGLLFYGQGGTLFRTAPDGTAASELLETPNRGSLVGHVEIDGGLLFYGASGMIFRTSPDGTAAGKPLGTPSNHWLSGHVEIDGGLLFYGEFGTLFRTELDGTAAGELLDTPGDDWLYGHVELDGGLMFYGQNGMLFRTALDGSRAVQVLDTPNDASLSGHAEIDGGLLFYGENGTLWSGFDTIKTLSLIHI